MSTRSQYCLKNSSSYASKLRKRSFFARNSPLEVVKFLETAASRRIRNRAARLQLLRAVVAISERIAFRHSSPTFYRVTVSSACLGCTFLLHSFRATDGNAGWLLEPSQRIEATCCTSSRSTNNSWHQAGVTFAVESDKVSANALSWAPAGGRRPRWILKLNFSKKRLFS